MRPRPWFVLLWVLLVSTVASGRETRRGTVLVAGQGGESPVLYVAARLSTLVDFEGLLEPRAFLTPELSRRIGVVAVGARSLVVVPVRDLARGERVLLPVTGRSEAGEPRTVTLALVTREDEVDLWAQVSLGPREPEAAEEGGVSAVPVREVPCPAGDSGGRLWTEEGPVNLVGPRWPTPRSIQIGKSAPPLSTPWNGWWRVMGRR